MVFALHLLRRNNFLVCIHTSMQGDAICIFGFDAVNSSLFYYLEVMRRGFISEQSLRGVYPQLHIL